MPLIDLKSQLPEYAKDLKLNLTSLIEEESLTDQQKFGTFLACALASKNEIVIKAALETAGEKMSEEAVTAAKAAASIMAMNNVYYRFVHLTGGDYTTMPAKLRMNVIGRPGIEKVDFELYSMAVSAVNGCGMCMESHDAVLKKAGMKAEQVQTAVRIGAVVNAISATLAGEAAMA